MPLVHTLAKGLEMKLVSLGAITTKLATTARATFSSRMTQVAITIVGSLAISPHTTQLHSVEAIQTLVHHSRVRTIHMVHHQPIVIITLNRMIGEQNAGALVHQRRRATHPEHHDQKAHGILVVEMISTFEANMDVPFRGQESI